MWYEMDYPATWAGLNSFLSGVLRLFSGTLSAMEGLPVMVLFLVGALMVISVYLFRDLAKSAKK